MNERIFSLIQELNGYRGLLWTEEDKEEFALLIIQKCAELFPNVYVSVETEHGHTPVIVADYIKEHFGVEE